MMMKTMKMMQMRILLNLETMKERMRMSLKTKEVRRQRSMKSEKEMRVSQKNGFDVFIKCKFMHNQ
jgi:hypothetical protein